MKVTIDDLFEKDEGNVDMALERLRVWEQRLRVLWGMALLWVLLVPEIFDGADDIAYAPLVWLALLAVPAIIGSYLLVWPSWRRVPFAARRQAITRAFTIAILVFGSVSLILALEPNGGSPALIFLLVAVVAGYGLQRLNSWWEQRNSEVLFP